MTDFSKLSNLLKSVRRKKNHVKDKWITLPWIQHLLFRRAAFLMSTYMFRKPSNLCQDKANQKMISRSKVVHKQYAKTSTFYRNTHL